MKRAAWILVVIAAAATRTVGAAGFDHALLDGLLARHVDDDGWVDYEGLAREAAVLDRYIGLIAAARLDEMEPDERLALLINAYNAFTLRLILDHYPLASIKDIPAAKRWAHRRWNVGGHSWSLDDIEHEQIRPAFREPRIHFALVCAAAGCPPLRDEAYTADRLEAQLEDQARRVHAGDRWLRYDGGGTVFLTKLYDWYAADFEKEAGSVLAYAARYSAPLREALDAGTRVRIRWIEYDWALNTKAGAP